MEEEQLQEQKAVLRFSTHLRRDIHRAVRQLAADEGQADTTIDKEVRLWLNR